MLWDRRFGAAALPQSFLPHTITNAGVLADGLRWWTAATGLRDFDVDAPIVDSRLTNFGRLGGTTTDADEFSLRFFTWTRRDGFKDLGAWPDEFVVTSDINDRGDLLFNSGTLGTAVVLDRDGNTHTLPREPNVIDVVAVALNLQREVIGFKLITQGNPPLRSSRSVVWDAKRGYRDLDALLYGITTGHSQFIPTAINEWGWIAGSTHDSAALALPVPAGNRRYENLRRLQGPKLCRALDEIRVHRVLCSLRD